jgi:hypothetical protein
MELLGKLPTTQARVVVTLLLCLGTAIKYWASKDWDPALDWLAFLAAMSGLDMAQFGVKRTTDASYVSAKQGTTPTAPNTGGQP